MGVLVQLAEEAVVVEPQRPPGRAPTGVGIEFFGKQENAHDRRVWQRAR